MNSAEIPCAICENKNGSFTILVIYFRIELVNQDILKTLFERINTVGTTKHEIIKTVEENGKTVFTIVFDSENDHFAKIAKSLAKAKGFVPF